MNKRKIFLAILEYVIVIPLMAVGLTFFALGFLNPDFDEEHNWTIPPNVIVEYKGMTCYIWAVPSPQNPKQQYRYCEQKEYKR